MKKLSAAALAMILACSFVFAGCDSLNESIEKKHKDKEKSEKVEDEDDDEDEKENDKKDKKDKNDKDDEDEDDKSKDEDDDKSKDDENDKDSDETEPSKPEKPAKPVKPEKPEKPVKPEKDPVATTVEETETTTKETEETKATETEATTKETEATTKETEETKPSKETEPTTKETESTNSTEDYDYSKFEKLYKPCLTQSVELLSGFDENDYDSRFDEFGYYWLNNRCYTSGADVVSKDSGYLFHDFNNDGIPELVIISETGIRGDSEGVGSYVNAIFTLEDDKPVCILEGWYRNSYYLLNDFTLGYVGSGGAAFSFVGILDFSENLSDEVWKEYYYTEPTEDYEDIYFYSDPTPYNENDRKEVSEDVFDAEYTKISDNYAEVPFTSFEQFAKANNMNVVFPSTPIEVWGFPVSDDEVADYYYDYTRYSIPDIDEGNTVYFYCNKNVKDLCITRISIEDVDEDGNLYCDITPITEIGNYRNSDGLLLDIVFWGDLPTYGVSFQYDGLQYDYAISMLLDYGMIEYVPIFSAN